MPSIVNSASLYGDVSVLQGQADQLILVADALAWMAYATVVVGFACGVVGLISAVALMRGWGRPQPQLAASLDSMLDVLAQVEAEQAGTAKLRQQVETERKRIETLRSLHGDQLAAIDRTLRPGARWAYFFGFVGVVSLAVSVLIAVAQHNHWF